MRPQKSKKVQRIIRSIIISSLLSLAVFYYIVYSEAAEWPAFSKYWRGMLITVFLANLLGLILLWLNRKFNRSLPWNKNITIRFLAEAGSGILLLAALSFIFVFVYVKQEVILDEGEELTALYLGSMIRFGFFSVIIICLYSLANFSVFSFNQYAYYQIESIRTERTQLNLQFEALKSQLSPHFLFNALNTISSLIYKDIRQAEGFIRQMAHTYSYILNTDKSRLVKINQEIDMVKSYYFMQKTRFGDSVILSIDLDETTGNFLIPPLTLQMLVENVLKHNHIHTKEPIQINIEREANKIVISNNIVAKPELLKIGNNLIDRPKPKKSHKIGLSNIRQRYAFFTTEKIEVIIHSEFIVKLPLINQPREKETIL